MSHTPRRPAHGRPVHGSPAARRTVIGCPDDALQIFAASSGGHDDTLVIALDDQRGVLGVIAVTDTVDPDAVLVVLDVVAAAAETQPGVAALIVASIRPDGRLDIDDFDRWHRADQACDDAGLELVEWFVIGHTVSLPREWCGVPSRWPW